MTLTQSSETATRPKHLFKFILIGSIISSILLASYWAVANPETTKLTSPLPEHSLCEKQTQVKQLSRHNRRDIFKLRQKLGALSKTRVLIHGKISPEYVKQLQRIKEWVSVHLKMGAASDRAYEYLLKEKLHYLFTLQGLGPIEAVKSLFEIFSSVESWGFYSINEEEFLANIRSIIQLVNMITDFRLKTALDDEEKKLIDAQKIATFLLLDEAVKHTVNRANNQSNHFAVLEATGRAVAGLGIFVGAMVAATQITVVNPALLIASGCAIGSAGASGFALFETSVDAFHQAWARSEKYGTDYSCELRQHLKASRDADITNIRSAAIIGGISGCTVVGAARYIAPKGTAQVVRWAVGGLAAFEGYHTIENINEARDHYREAEKAGKEGRLELQKIHLDLARQKVGHSIKNGINTAIAGLIFFMIPAEMKHALKEADDAVDEHLLRYFRAQRQTDMALSAPKSEAGAVAEVGAAISTEAAEFAEVTQAQLAYIEHVDAVTKTVLYDGSVSAEMAEVLTQALGPNTVAEVIESALAGEVAEALMMAADDVGAAGNLVGRMALGGMNHGEDGNGEADENQERSAQIILLKYILDQHPELIKKILQDSNTSSQLQEYLKVK